MALPQLNTDTDSQVWEQLRDEAKALTVKEPALSHYVTRCVLSHNSMAAALTFMLSSEVSGAHLQADVINAVMRQAIMADPAILTSAIEDLRAHVERDPAAKGYLTPFLYFKGFHALQVHRIAHWLYHQNREELASYMHARASQVYDVDIHPAAKMGRGIMIDHATGVVIGETAVVEDCVSMLHGVTLGGTGKESGDRHPKIRRGVLLGAGARILGNIEVGEGAKVGASSLVLEAVPPHTTVAGVPAKIIGHTECDNPATDMHHELCGQSS